MLFFCYFEIFTGNLQDSVLGVIHYKTMTSHVHTVVWECCKDDRQS